MESASVGNYLVGWLVSWLVGLLVSYLVGFYNEMLQECAC